MTIVGDAAIEHEAADGVPDVAEAHLSLYVSVRRTGSHWCYIWRGHGRSVRIVIVGGGQVGSALARTLAPDHEVVVVDHDRTVADVFSAMDVEFIVGSGTSEEVLGRAGIEHGAVFRRLHRPRRSQHRRLRDRQPHCQSRDDLPGVARGLRSRIAAASLEQFGIDRVLWPEAQLAADIEQVVTAPGAIDAEVFAGGVIRLLEYKLDASSTLTSAPLGQLHLPRGSLIVAVKRGAQLFVPRGATQLAAGDKIIIMGTPEAMQEVEAIVNPSRGRGRTHVTIIGGGDVGLELAERLEQCDTVDIRIMERDLARGEMLAGRLRRTLVLNGDGTDLEFLESENVGAERRAGLRHRQRRAQPAGVAARAAAGRAEDRDARQPARRTCGCSSASASTSRCRRAARRSRRSFIRLPGGSLAPAGGARARRSARARS